MTTEQIERMQAGKREARERRDREYRRQLERFRIWLKDESRAWREQAQADDWYGFDSSEYREARKNWLITLRRIPKPPPDHAWPDH